MKVLLSYLLTPLCHLAFGLLLVIFHVLQVISLKVFGENARQKVVNVLNWFLVYSLRIMGSSIKFKGFDNLPEGRPVIIVSNHQSLYDIPAIILGFKMYTPKFISKIELGKGLPSISYNLTKGKSALIDRKNPPQAIKEIFKLGKLIQSNNHAACIFPEGTRSKNGKVKKFKVPGINTLLRAAPDAIIIPFAIDGHSKVIKNGMFPLSFGEKITYTALDAIDPKGRDVEEIVAEVEQSIKTSLGQ